MYVMGTYILYIILLKKTTAARSEVALSYHKVRGLYFLAVVFAATIIVCSYGAFAVHVLHHTVMHH